MNRHILKFFFAIVASLFLANDAFSSGPPFPLTYHTVALSGQQAPGLASGIKFNQFSKAIINDSGKVAFEAEVNSGGIEGLWTEGTGALSLVAAEGTQAPGTPAGAVFESLNDYYIFDNGRVGFTATLKMNAGGVTVDNDKGIWTQSTSGLNIAVREGDQAPGSSQNFHQPLPAVNFTRPVFNSAGNFAFQSYLGNFNSTGIWSSASGTVNLVAKTGDTAAGVQFGDFQYPQLNNLLLFSPVMNDSGKVAFVTEVSGATSTNSAVWTNSTGPLTIVARKGTAPPGVVTSGTVFSSFDAPVINAGGKVAFRAQIAGGVGLGNIGIWSNVQNSLQLVAQLGNQAPGTEPGTVFQSLSVPLLSSSGKTVFTGGLNGVGTNVTSKNNSGIWTSQNGVLTSFLRKGDLAPGTPAGSIFTDITLPAMNSSGMIAFDGAFATLSAPSTNLRGLWAQNQQGDLTLVVKQGDLFEVAPGDFRTISNLDFETLSGGDDGRNVTFNDAFTLSFELNFTDGTSGIFTASLIPEPNTWAMIVCCGIGICFFAKHQRSKQIAA